MDTATGTAVMEAPPGESQEVPGEVLDVGKLAGVTKETLEYTVLQNLAAIEIALHFSEKSLPKEQADAAQSALKRLTKSWVAINQQLSKIQMNPEKPVLLNPTLGRGREMFSLEENPTGSSGFIPENR